MPYINIGDSHALAGALCAGGPVNRRRDGSAGANLSVVHAAPVSLGQMNILRERDSVRDAVRVAYSFLTPIAWELADGRWIVSVQQYSPSTRQHQMTVAKAIADAFDRKRGPFTVDGRDGVAVLYGPVRGWPIPAAA